MTHESRHETERVTELRTELPVAENEDVEFSEEQADEDDMEAVERAKATDHRAAEVNRHD